MIVVAGGLVIVGSQDACIFILVRFVAGDCQHHVGAFSLRKCSSNELLHSAVNLRGSGAGGQGKVEAVHQALPSTFAGTATALPPSCPNLSPIPG